MQRLPSQDRFYQTQTLHRHQNHSSPVPGHSKTPVGSLSATVDRRITPSAYYRDYSRYNATDVIEPYPAQNRNSVSPKSSQNCKDLGSSYGGSSSSNIAIQSDTVPHIPGLPTQAQVDATVTCLWILTPLSATISAVIILIAISTNQWLHTEERISNPLFNGTGDKDYLSKFTVSGLWKMCSTDPGERSFDCSKIDYFSKEEYSPDPSDSTSAIPYAVTKSSVFLLLATAVLFAGYLCCAVGHCARNRRICTFTSGVLFIVSGETYRWGGARDMKPSLFVMAVAAAASSGLRSIYLTQYIYYTFNYIHRCLLMLIGLVMYISIFKAEVGSKLKEPSITQGPMFTYRYGYSFILYVSGFITIEMAGTSAVLLFIYWYQKDWLVKLTEKHSEKYSSESSISYSNLDQNSAYPCRRHPEAYAIQRSQPIGAVCEPSTSKAYVSPSKQRRYYFDKGVMSPSCSMHRKNVYVTASMRDVSGGYNPTSYTFEDFRNNDNMYLNSVGSTRSLATSNGIPRDATTNTVSTTADIVNPGEEFGYNMESNTIAVFKEDFVPSVREHEFVTFSVDPNRNAASSGVNRSMAGDALRRTTPV